MRCNACDTHIYSIEVSLKDGSAYKNICKPLKLSYTHSLIGFLLY